MSWAGAANIQDSVTIDMSALDSVSVNEAGTLTTVGPGARWGDVYLVLDALNLAVSGGRVNTVGVGGLLLGGKLLLVSILLSQKAEEVFCPILKYPLRKR
jgi:FAD/FMN-containing dehydrogenase